MGIARLDRESGAKMPSVGKSWEEWYQTEYLTGAVCHCCGEDAETSDSKWGPLCAACWSCPVNGCEVAA